MNHTAKGTRRKPAKLRNVYDDTVLMEGDINPDDLPPRPVSQMEYDEIIAYHLRKYTYMSSLPSIPLIF